MTFVQLAEQKTPAVEEVKKTFRYYAHNNAAITAKAVIRIIHRAEPTPSDKKELEVIADLGIKNMADLGFTKEADEYALVRDALC